MEKEKILISACLIGLNCKYNGGNNENNKLVELMKEKDLIPICPEQLGGLKTPRTNAERKQAKVITKEGVDVTKEYQRGAEEVLNLAKKLNIKKAILKSRSPSCGIEEIYDGTFSHTLTKKDGVTAELLKKNGIEVISSDRYVESVNKSV